MSMKVLLLCVVLFAVSAAAGNDHHHDDHDENHHCEALPANKTNSTGNSTKEHHHEDHAKIDGLKGGALAIIFTASMIVNSFVIFASVRVSPFWLSIMSSLSGGVMLKRVYATFSQRHRKACKIATMTTLVSGTAPRLCCAASGISRCCFCSALCSRGQQPWSCPWNRTEAREEGRRNT